MFGGGEGSAAGWQVVGPATGAITVQRSARIGLWTYNRTTDKLSSLSRLHPDDLHGLSLEDSRQPTWLTDGHLTCIQGLTALAVCRREASASLGV